MKRRLSVTAIFVLLIAVLCRGQDAKERQAEPLPASIEAEKVYIPQDLDDTFVELKRLLPPADIDKIRNGTEDDAARYHHGLGTGLRNTWGLWAESRLAKYFHGLGIYHADDMSGIILTSFWRHLNGKPVQLEEQIAYYKKYWEDEKKAADMERRRVLQVKQRLPGMLMGIVLAKKDVPLATMPDRTGEELRVRSLSSFRGGAFLTVRSQISDDGNDFQTTGYFFDSSDEKVHPIRVAEITEIHSTVVIGDDAWFLGKNGTDVRLLRVGGEERVDVPLPRSGGALPQLGVSKGSILAVYPNAVYQLNGDKWTELYAGELKLPRSGPPPLLVENQLFLRDEGSGENAKRLWWLDIAPNPKLTSLDEDVGLIGPEGPRWENSFSYHVTNEGVLWATLGEGYARKSLVKRNPEGEYRIAILNNNLHFDGELLGAEQEDQGLSVSAVAEGSGGELLLVGDRGFYRLKDRTLVQEVAFGNTHQEISLGGGNGVLDWSWDPSKILVLAKDCYLISGDFGGVYILGKNGAGKFELIALDQELGTPVTF